MDKKKEEKIEKMIEGGKILSEVKKALKKKVKIGASAQDIERLANKLIEEKGAKASFKMVKNYSWATCVNVNNGVVHGIPNKNIIFKKGDVVSVDVGLFYKGFHTDTSFTVGLEVDRETSKFIEKGKAALGKAIKRAKKGNYIYDISETIEKELKKHGFHPVEALVGHGVGKKLHEEPKIPCFVEGKRKNSPLIKDGDTYAIEVMYTLGEPDLVIEPDGWTISTKDGKIASLFEETVAVMADGPVVLTDK